LKGGCNCRRKRAGGMGGMVWTDAVLEGGIGLEEDVVCREAVTEGGRGLEEGVVWREDVTEGERGLEEGCT
jgi:hypothetical protein